MDSGESGREQTGSPCANDDADTAKSATSEFESATPAAIQAATLHLYTLLSLPSLRSLTDVSIQGKGNGVDALSEVLWWLSVHCQAGSSGYQEECYNLIVTRLNAVHDQNNDMFFSLVNRQILDALIEYLRRQQFPIEKTSQLSIIHAARFRTHVNVDTGEVGSSTDVTMELLLKCCQEEETLNWLKDANTDVFQRYINPDEPTDDNDGGDDDDDGDKAHTPCGQREREMQTRLIALVIMAEKMSPEELCKIPIGESLHQMILSSMEVYVHDVVEMTSTGHVADCLQLAIGRGILLLLHKLCTSEEYARSIAAFHHIDLPVLLDVVKYEHVLEKGIALEIISKLFPHLDDHYLEDHVKRDILDTTFHAYEDVRLSKEALSVQLKIRERILRQMEVISEAEQDPCSSRTMLDIVVRRLNDCARKNLTRKIWFLLHGMSTRERQLILVSAPEKLRRKPLIHDAIQQGHLELVKILHEEYESDIDLEYQGKTSVGVAAASGQLGVMRYLVQKGARVNAASAESFSTPLVDACRKGFVEIVIFLLSKGADVVETDSEGNSCVHALSTYNKNPSYLLELFILCGADINLKNTTGRTPLHAAVEAKSCARGPHLVKTLLARDANFGIYDSDGYSPLGRAVVCQHWQAIEILTKFGAHNTPCTTSGENVYQVATCNHSRSLFLKLVDHLKPLPKEELSALEFWVSYHARPASYRDLRRVFELRESTGTQWSCSEPCDGYDKAHTVTSVNHIDQLENDKEGLLMCSLHLRERVLGKHHPRVLEGLELAARDFKNDYNYCAANKLLVHALKIQQGSPKTPSPSCLVLLKSYSALLKVCQETGSYLEVEFADSYRAVNLACEQVEGLESAEDVQGKPPVRQGALQVLVDVIFAVTCCLLDDEQTITLRRRIRQLIAMSPTDENGEGILHKSMNVLKTSTLCYEILTRESLFLELKLQKLFLSCGAPAYHVDESGNSCLHAFLKSGVQRKSFDRVKNSVVKAVTETFLNAGAHFDAKNKHGQSIEDLLESLGVTTQKLHYVGLKCLAARVVYESVPGNQDMLPAQVAKFVTFHGAH